MPSAIKFQVRAVHDVADRRRVTEHIRGLRPQYWDALGGVANLNDGQRAGVENAIELVALFELGRDRVEGSTEPGDPAALKRLEDLAAKAVAELGLRWISRGRPAAE